MEEDNNSVVTEMEIDDEEEDNIFPTPLAILDGKYHLFQKLGEGSTASVYLGHSPCDKTHTLYSFKIVNPDKNDKTLFEREVEMLGQIDHENVMKVYHSGMGKLQKANGEINERYYIMLEYLPHGELLDYIYLNGGFGEEYARLIMNDLLNGLEACHDSGIVHRDIKGENIMLDKDYKVKLVDFGFATNKTQGKLTTFLGTLNYAAPELHLHQPYYGVCSDIFSLGVTIYVIITGSLPFKYPVINDSLYKYIFRNDYNSFWAKKKFQLSPSFKELFNSMIAMNYTQRPSIAEIRKSKWMREMKEELIPQLKTEYMRRELIVKQKREEMIMKKNIVGNQCNKENKVYKGDQFDYNELISKIERINISNKESISKYAIETNNDKEKESYVIMKRILNEKGYEYKEDEKDCSLNVSVDTNEKRRIKVYLKKHENKYYIDFDKGDMNKEEFLRFYHNILILLN